MVDEVTGIATLHHAEQGSALTPTLTPTTPVGEEEGEEHPGGSPAEVSADLKMIQTQLSTSQQETEDLRKLTDKLLLMPGINSDKSPGELSSEDRQKMVEDFEADPNAFIAKEIAKALEGNEDIQDAKETSVKLKAERAQEKLGEAVEDFKDVFASTGFREFIAKNPVYGRVLQDANASFDVAAIAGVLNHYKETSVDNGDGKDTKSNPLNASKKKSGTSNAAGPILSRAKIKELAVKDPLGYAKMDAEITLAYKEGRVK